MALTFPHTQVEESSFYIYARFDLLSCCNQQMFEVSGTCHVTTQRSQKGRQHDLVPHCSGQRGWGTKSAATMCQDMCTPQPTWPKSWTLKTTGGSHSQCGTTTCKYTHLNTSFQCNTGCSSMVNCYPGCQCQNEILVLGLTRYNYVCALCRCQVSGWSTYWRRGMLRWMVAASRWGRTHLE